MLAEEQVLPEHEEVGLLSPQTQEAGRIRRILIVDDSPSLTFVIQQMLDIAGYETRTAYDAQSGYRSYVAFRPDLIITDVFMNGESGPQMMERIGTLDSGLGTIYMSGYPFAPGELFHPEDATHRGPYFLQKPFSRSQLLHTISRFSE